MSSVIAAYVSSLRLGLPVRADGVAAVPIFAAESSASDYLSLAEALERGEIEISEKPAAEVPHLVVINKASIAVLIVMGDELVGGMQNRIVNTTVLLKPRSVTELPVSCVEQGRWSHAAKGFGLGERAYSKLRFQMEEEVKASLRREGTHRANQSRVWASVGQEARRVGARSRTGAMRDAYEHDGSRLRAIEKDLAYVEGAVGVACLTGARVAFAECFGSHAACRRAWPRLVRSAAFEAIGLPPKSGLLGRVEEFLEVARSAEVEGFPAAGLGEDVRFSAPSLSGSAIVVDGAVVHWSAIAK